MGLKKNTRTDGHYLEGSEVKIDSQLVFNNVGNPLFDTSNGSVLWYVKSDVSNSFRFRDNVKGKDLIKMDTSDDVITIDGGIVYNTDPVGSTSWDDLSVPTKAYVDSEILSATGASNELSEILANGNLTGANTIDHNITSGAIRTGGGFFQEQLNISNNEWLVTNDLGVFSNSALYISDDYISGDNYGTNGEYAGFEYRINNPDSFGRITFAIKDSHFFRADYNVGVPFQGTSQDTPSTILSSNNGTVNADIRNSVIAGGDGVIANKNGYLFTKNFEAQGGTAGYDAIRTLNADTEFAHKKYVDDEISTAVGGNNQLSEILANGNTSGGTDIIMTSGDAVTSPNGNVKVRLEDSLYGSSNVFEMTTDGGVYGESIIYARSGEMEIGYGYNTSIKNGMQFEPTLVKLSHDNQVVFETYTDGSAFGILLQPGNSIKYLNPATSSLDWGDRSVPDKAYVDSQILNNNQLSEILANGNTSGGTDIVMTTGDSLVFNNSSFTTTISEPTLTTNQTVNFPDKSGTIALLDLINDTQTTDATLTTLSDTITIESNSLVEFNAKIVAVQSGGTNGSVGDSMVKQVKGVIKNIAGTTAIVGTITEIDIAFDSNIDNGSGQTKWIVDVVANDTSDLLEVEIRGETGKTIEWKTTIETTISSY